MIKATFEALKVCQSPRGIASRRGKKVGEIVARRTDQLEYGIRTGIRPWRKNKQLRLPKLEAQLVARGINSKPLRVWD